MSARRASHSGSWYAEDGNELNHQLSGWLNSVPMSSMGSVRAIIAPHAGYSYCGACGGHAYKQVDPSNVKRVFILGPSHHVRLSGCDLTRTERYQTPLYDLHIDKLMCQELHNTGLFGEMGIDTDEEEHSIEMHLPYVAKVMESRRGQFTIVPVLVGSLSTDKEKQYGQLFSRYLADPENLFVISSDFCHWGKRFHYTFHEKSWGNIHKSIERLDKMGMNIIESMDSKSFAKYLKEYHNTICGRHPIGILLNAIETLRSNGNGRKMALKFVQYAQSSKCQSMGDSSVSYASAVLTIQ